MESFMFTAQLSPSSIDIRKDTQDIFYFSGSNEGVDNKVVEQSQTQQQINEIEKNFEELSIIKGDSGKSGNNEKKVTVPSVVDNLNNDSNIGARNARHERKKCKGKENDRAEKNWQRESCVEGIASSNNTFSVLGVGGKNKTNNINNNAASNGDQCNSDDDNTDSNNNSKSSNEGEECEEGYASV